MPGPVPKRTDQRRRKNKPDVPVIKAAAGSSDQSQALHRGPDPRWHPLAKELFVSLSHSGQSQFYEPSDWAYARWVMKIITETLEGRGERGLNGQLVSAVDTMLSKLLTTEADRRRARVELERKEPQPEPASVAIMAKYRSATKT